MTDDIKQEVGVWNQIQPTYRRTYSVSSNSSRKQIMKELPEKWYVRRTFENSEILNDWNNNHPLFRKQNRTKADAIQEGDYFYNDASHTGTVRDNYTEISFEDFQTWVLYATTEPQSTIPEDLSYLIPLINKL